MKKLFLFLLINTLPLFSQVPFNLQPSWISQDVAGYGTGGALADINNDGWLDLVVANGNDMSRQNLTVYYNNNGTLSLTPGWQSADIDYNGHIDAGDINKDGFIDIVVSVYLGPSGFSSKGKLKMYLNNNGVLSSSPSWTSSESFYTFSCALGDADGDGDLDLAAATGESYYQHPEQKRIYYNNNGTLSSTAGWTSLAAGYAMDVEWADIDNDNDLDLVFVEERQPNKVFLNYGDSIGTVPVWQSGDASLFANSLFIKDVNNDGLRDLAVSDNNQTGGTGRFKIYLNNSGIFSSTPYWSSAFAGYGSGINLADIDNDNDNDLITGGWWQPCRIYVNNNGTFPTTPAWTSTSSSVVEAILMGDIDNDRQFTDSLLFTSTGSVKLIYLPHAPIYKIIQILFDNIAVPYSGYCYDSENAWVSLNSVPPPGGLIKIIYQYSLDLDMAITNWDPDAGNYLFINNSPVPVELISFTAGHNGNYVTLNWATATETNNLGFEIQRSSGLNEWITIGFQKGAGTTLLPQQYSFTDGNLQNGKYIYRLKQIDMNGEYTYSKEAEVIINSVLEYSLDQNYPNPFNPETVIGFSIPHESRVNISVYNLLGKKIIQLKDEIMQAGYYNVLFNGSELPSGIYLCKMQAGSFGRIIKMIFMK